MRDFSSRILSHVVASMMSGLRLVDRHVDGARGGGLRDDDAGPGGAAVLGHEQAARRLGVVQRTHDGDEDPVVVARVDDDLADRVAVLEAHVRPRRTVVGGLVDALAVVGRAAAVVELAGAGPDDALGVDSDCTDRLRQVVVPRGLERRTAVRGPPEASGAGARCRRRPACVGSAAMSRTRPPMLLGPSSVHTWSVLGEPLLALPITLDCAIASLTAASGIEPSAFARWRYIHSSAPSGSGTAADGPAAACSVPSLPVTTAAPTATRTTRAPAAATISGNFLVCIGTRTSPGRLARLRSALPPRRLPLLADIDRVFR